jgi:hypothetical protein
MTPQDEPVVPAETAATWRAAEEQLYGSLVWDPDRYQRAVALVGAVVGRLRMLGPSSDRLRRAAQSPDGLVRQVAAEAGIGTQSLDLLLVARGALSLRLREVVGEQARLRRLSRIVEAARGPDPWVVLEESGDPRGDPFAPYHRLEVEVSTGRALYVTAVPDDAFTGVLHEVATLQVDLVDGSLRDPAADGEALVVPPSRHQDWVAREQRVEHLRGGHTHS